MATVVVGSIMERDFDEFLTVLADPSTVPADYNTYVENIDELMHSINRKGRTPVKMDFELGYFVDWCTLNGRTIDADAVADYAASIYYA